MPGPAFSFCAFRHKMQCCIYIGTQKCCLLLLHNARACILLFSFCAFRHRMHCCIYIGTPKRCLALLHNARACIFLLCLQAQDALLHLHWDPDILQLDYCGPVLDRNDQLLFAGPRVRMGVYEGVPLRVQPHTVSGRADYFGRLVNRSVGAPDSATSNTWAGHQGLSQANKSYSNNSC